jgi:beta-lactamase class A
VLFLRRLVPIVTASVLAVVAAAGCSGSHHGGGSSSPTHATATSAPPPTEILPTSIPATPVGAALRWLLAAVNARSGPTAADAQTHLATSFLAAVPVSRVIATVAQVRSAGPLTLQAYLATSLAAGEASVSQPGERRSVITLATDATGKISSLLLKLAPPLPTITSPADFQQAAQRVGVWSSVLVATARPDGTCSPRQTLGDQGPHPLGSMFKLYVLAAVARAVQAGALHWDTQLTVTQQVKSLPSGQLQDAPTGTRISVQQAAALMISISDNTAADMLIAAVGQASLASAIKALGNAHPVLLDPLLTTRQMFTLQYDDPALRRRWAATLPGLVSTDTGAVHDPASTSSDTRAALLAQLPTGAPSVTSQSRPGWLDGIEWYASPTDICRAQVGLHDLAHTPAGQPIAAIMAKNPGVPVGPGWTYVGYKGGSDAGVLTGSWYLQPPVGPATVVVIQLSAGNAAAIPDDIWYAIAAGGLLQHLPR